MHVTICIENKTNLTKNQGKWLTFLLPDPLVWSPSGPVLEDGVDPVWRVQSKTSELDCPQPSQRPLLKSQLTKIKKNNTRHITLLTLFLIYQFQNLYRWMRRRLIFESVSRDLGGGEGLIFEEGGAYLEGYLLLGLGVGPGGLIFGILQYCIE